MISKLQKLGGREISKTDEAKVSGLRRLERVAERNLSNCKILQMLGNKPPSQPHLKKVDLIKTQKNNNKLNTLL